MGGRTASQMSRFWRNVIPQTSRKRLRGELGGRARDLGGQFLRQKCHISGNGTRKKLFCACADDLHQCDPHDTNLILTEAPNAPQVLQANCDQMVFEEFEFSSYFRCVGK